MRDSNSSSNMKMCVRERERKWVDIMIMEQYGGNFVGSQSMIVSYQLAKARFIVGIASMVWVKFDIRSLLFLEQ